MRFDTASIIGAVSARKKKTDAGWADLLDGFKKQKVVRRAA
jgi:hypothetical protein